MFITLRAGTDAGGIERSLRGMGLWTERLASGDGGVAIAVTEPSPAVDVEQVAALPGVLDVLMRQSKRPRVDFQAGKPALIGAFRLGATTLGDGSNAARPMLVAGPCGAESEAQVHQAAEMAANAGATLLRGGAFKPRTSPYAFSGHGGPALIWLHDAATAHGMGLVTEVMTEAQVDAVAAVADMLQIGSRNMQNFDLLRAAGRSGKPLLLKRSRSATIDEWLSAGEHALLAGAASVVFCERGVTGLDPHTRNLLDLGAVALLKHALGQPVMVDPSHAAGRRDLVPALAAAALAAGADAVMVECHPDPGAALSDGPQALDESGLAAVAQAIEQATIARRGAQT